MKINDLSFMVGGAAGEGITRSGYLLAKACMRGGLCVFGANDYQSRIRGGHNFYTVRVKEEKVYSQHDFIDLLIALNRETVELHVNELNTGGGIICDSDDLASPNQKLSRDDVTLHTIPLRKIVRDELKEQSIMRNTVALGGAIALLEYEFTLLEEVLKDTFKAEIAESNIKAARTGYRYILENAENASTCRLRKTAKAGKGRIFVSGNEAVGLGAIQAGCKLYAAYPMTPTTGLLAFMAENERKCNMIFIQPEGEIAALNIVAGAFLAGARAMTSTSGGGFSLMTEALGMIGMTETPAVIMVGQRTGPSTGLPTYSSQADLRFILHASQGEFPRVIIAPGDTEECFYETMRAFNWAEKYQLPVILLTDKYLVESQTSQEPFDGLRVKIDRGNLVTGEFKGAGEYKRYEFTESGVSPRAIPLTKGAVVRTNADTHDEWGYTSEDPVTTRKMIDKTMSKLSCMAVELEETKVEMTKFYGPENAEATIIAWGSTKGPILEAMSLLNEKKPLVNYLQVIYLQPFPEDTVMRTMDKAKKTLVIENNRNSQLSSLIRDYLLREPDHTILKYDGRPFNPLCLAGKVKEALA